MMNIANFFLLLCLVLTSCRTQVPRQYFNRPEYDPTISNGDGTGYRNGELVDSTENMLCIEPTKYQKLEEYWIDKEYRLYVCLRFNNCN